MEIQKGNAFLIITVIIGVIAIGAVGFVSWKYFGKVSELEQLKEEQTQPSYLPEKEKTVSEMKEKEIIPSKKTGEIADLSSEASAIEDWKTYESNEYRISYPENCSIEKIKDESAFCPGDTQGIERLEYIEIENCNTFIDIYSNPNNLTVQKWNNIYHTLTCTGSGLAFNIQTLINDLSVTKGLFGCCSAMQKAVAIRKNNKIYLIHSREVLGLSDNSPDKKEKELWLEGEINDSNDIFNQILSTFKFIKQNSLNEIQTGKFKINYEEINKIQQSVNEGHQPWRLDSKFVITAEGLTYGFTNDDFETMKQISLNSASAGTAEYEVIHNNKSYLVTLIKPIPGENKIWIISEIKEK